MNDTYATPLPYVCISPELGRLMNVCLILKADVQNISNDRQLSTQRDKLSIDMYYYRTVSVLTCWGSAREI